MKLISSLLASAKSALFVLLILGSGFLMPSPTRAASLQFVPQWGASGVPTNLSMYIYVPDRVVANPPILVLLHYWGGGASGIFAEAQNAGIVAAADQYGFIMVVPQNPDCWDVNSTATLTHDGGGHTQGIAQMVKYAVNTYHANSNRVYVTGTSCGGMMTEALLAVYPDVFKAGAAFSGQVVGGAWTPITHTAQEWGNIDRACYPGYTGPRPRVQLWHGTADGIINYSNQVEAIMQWGNVLGLSINPTTTTTLTIGNITNQWTHQVWKDACGNTVLDAWSEQNGPHGTDANLNAQYVIPFLGLNVVGSVDPVMSCGGLANGTYKLVARHSGKALDAFGANTTNGTQIIQWTYGSGNNQRWTVTSLGSGLYKIIGVQSGKSIDISNWGTANGTKVQLWDYLAGTNQKFFFNATSGGYYEISPSHATGSCLDVSGVSTADGALVQLWQYLSGNNQQWAPQTP